MRHDLLMRHDSWCLKHDSIVSYLASFVYTICETLLHDTIILDSRKGISSVHFLIHASSLMCICPNRRICMTPACTASASGRALAELHQGSSRTPGRGNLSPNGRIRQVKNTTSCHNFDTINLNLNWISTAPGGAVLKKDLQYKSTGTWYKF